MTTTPDTPTTPVNDFVSVRIITDQVRQLVDFYEQVLDTSARWATDDFAELVTPSCTLAIAASATIDLFARGAAVAAQNHTVILEFRVADVDVEFERLRTTAGFAGSVVQEPTTMPWGNRSALLRDPDGTLVNLFAPLTPDAIARFER